MFFKKLLNKIPYFRNREIRKMKRDLIKIKENFAEGFFNDEFVVELHNIVNNPLIEFSDEIVVASLGKVTMHTKTSVNAVKLLDKKYYVKSVLERSSFLTMSQTTDYFTNWYSNEESVTTFVEEMKYFLDMQVQSIKWSAQENSFEEQERIDEIVSNWQNPEMLESLLYRLLLEDLVSIISFYLENKYE